MWLRSTVRLRFMKSISWHHFQTIVELAKTDFQYHRGIIYSIYYYILTKKNLFFPHERNFTLIYGPFSCLKNVFFGHILMENYVCSFKCSLNFRAHSLPSEPNKVVYTNFAKFQLQSMSSKIGRAFEKTNKSCFLSSFCQLQP